MTRLFTFLFLTGLTLTTVQSFGQVDTTAINNFIQRQGPHEEKFIAFLKSRKIEDCMKYFSAGIIKKYGVDSLKKELKHLSTLLLKHPAPKVTYSLGQNFRGVGTFGHDSDGNFEKQSLYQFIVNDKVIYYFSLYYSDKEPVTLIKYYDSKNFEDDFWKKIKFAEPIKPPSSKGS